MKSRTLASDATNAPFLVCRGESGFLCLVMNIHRSCRGSLPRTAFSRKEKNVTRKRWNSLLKKNSGNFCTSGRVCTEQFYRLHDLSGPSHHIWGIPHMHTSAEKRRKQKWKPSHHFLRIVCSARIAALAFGLSGWALSNPFIFQLLEEYFISFFVLHST